MHKKYVALALLVAGCGTSAEGLVLVFPTSQLRTMAAHATLEVLQPLATGDECPQLLGFPPLQPPSSQVELTTQVDLNNGVASKPITIPNGHQTLLVTILDKTNTPYLHGCLTTTVAGGASVNVPLQSVFPPMVDMATVDLSAPDLAGPLVDMAMHKYLSVTVVEMRNSARKLSGVSLTITDSATMSATAMTDANGVVKLDTVGMTPPLSITASAPPTANNFQGAATLSGVSPMFTTSDTIAMSIPVELDPPPALVPSSTIGLTVPDSTNGQAFNLYWLSTNALPGDQVAPTAVTAAGANAMVATMALAAGSYRVVGVLTGAAPAAATTFFLAPGSTFTASNNGATGSMLQPLSATLTLTATKSASAAYTGASSAQSCGVILVVPAIPTEVAIPILADAPITMATQMFTAKVPPTAGSIQPSASFMTEFIATNSNANTAVRGELRHKFTANPGTGTDSISGVPDPPTVTLPASPISHTASFTISAAPAALFPLSSAFVHIHIHGTNGGVTSHWHLVAPAASPTTIVAPANVAAVGSYTVDVDFVQLFTPLADGSIQATLTDDYSKLIRLIPQELSRSTTTGVMVN